MFGQRARRMGVRVGSRSHSAGRIPAVVGPDADGHGRGAGAEARAVRAFQVTRCGAFSPLAHCAPVTSLVRQRFSPCGVRVLRRIFSSRGAGGAASGDAHGVPVCRESTEMTSYVGGGRRRSNVPRFVGEDADASRGRVRRDTRPPTESPRVR